VDTFVPHTHTCEIKLCKPLTWAMYSTLKCSLSETEDECELCEHFVTICFDPEKQLCMKEVIRVNV